MLNESEVRGREFTAQVQPTAEVAAADNLLVRLRDAVSEVFFIETESSGDPAGRDGRVTATYNGRLLIDSEQAYAQVDERFEPLDHVPVFSVVNGKQVVTALKGRFKVTPRDWKLNAVLFVATVLSLLFVGSGGNINNLLNGLPYALGVILILGTHELGHYFAARHHKVAVTLPYFIPLPLPLPYSLGTMGAFIQLREPMRNRKVLLDVGAAGPLAGLIVAIPVLLIGLKTSPVTLTAAMQIFSLKGQAGFFWQEGNSILYALAKIVTFGHFLPDGMRDVYINQLATAGWTGLLVTALNLIPVGQLDGGHAIYSLIGERARVLFFPALAILALLTTVSQVWIIWLILIFALGRLYATPLDMITPLNPRRRAIAIIALIVFVLVFVPVPFTPLFTIGP
jgi:hypothetical protein